MNRSNPRYQKIGMAVMVLALLSLVPVSLQAETGFRVSSETGLEPDSATPKTAAEKKPKPTAVAEKKTTEITCTGETSFDAKAGMAIFVKEVKVNDPQFSLTADKLTAFLKKAVKEPAKKDAPEAKPAETPDAKADAKPEDTSSPASGLERAVAEGNVVIIQDKTDEKTGEITHYIGKGAKADYNAVSGEMTLSGWPQIQQGLNNQVATEEGTVMIMNKDGHLRTVGRSKTVIQADAKPAKGEKTDKTETAKPDQSKIP